MWRTFTIPLCRHGNSIKADGLAFCHVGARIEMLVAWFAYQRRAFDQVAPRDGTEQVADAQLGQPPCTNRIYHVHSHIMVQTVYNIWNN